MSRHHDPNVQRAARRALAPLVASGMAVCWRCGQPIAPDAEWQAGHVDDLALGGHVAGSMVPEHQRCGSSAGAQLGNQLRARPRRRLAQWLAIFWQWTPPQPRAVLVSLPRVQHFRPRIEPSRP